MPQKTHTLDLSDAIEEKEEQAEEFKQKAVEIEEEANQYKEENGSDAEVPDDMEQEWKEYKAKSLELEQDIRTIEEKIEEWEGSEFVVSELTWGQIEAVSDDMMEESFEVDIEKQDIDGTPRQGFYKLELLRESVEQSPPNAPTRKDELGREAPSPGDYPPPVGEWLFDKVDALNTFGDASLGNLSLEDAISEGS